MATSIVPSQAADSKQIWDQNLPSESDFWEWWLSDDRFSQFCASRRPSNRPLQDDYTMHLDPRRPTYSILDVGSGPISTIGVHLPGKIVSLYPVDSLADDYSAMLDKYGIYDTVRPIKVSGEELTSVFPRNYFDICSCTNALDHCYDPIAVIRQMLAVCKLGGWLHLSHIINEGEREKYQGLHQWNLDWRNERLTIWNRKIETDVLDAVPGIAAIETQIVEGNPRGMTQWIQRQSREMNKTPPAGTKNVALGRPACQSSTSPWSHSPDPRIDARGGNNGSITGRYGFCTDVEDHPWWQVDLGCETPIIEIRVYNRLDSCASRARSLEILLSSDNERWHRAFSNDNRYIGGLDPLIFVAPADTRARFVKLQLAHRDYLHLDEIEVYGPI